MTAKNDFQQKQMPLHNDNGHSNFFQNSECINLNYSKLRKKYRRWFDTHVQPLRRGKREERFVIVTVYENGTVLTIRKKFLDETFAKNLHNCRLAETMEVATHFKEWIPYARFIRTEEGIHHPYSFSVYHTSYNGVNIEFKAKDDGCVYMMHFL